MTKLKPCPFCGGEAKLYEGDYGGGYYVICVGETECYCRMGAYEATDGPGCGTDGDYESREEAIEAWNMRYNEPTININGIE
jgi:ssDNA-binding Zn-finger/Zn-ribbon topoisomerase 1